MYCNTLQKTLESDTSTRAFVLAAIFDMKQRVGRCSIGCNLKTGEADFDSLTNNQQIAVLDHVQQTLVDEYENLGGDIPVVLETTISACLAFVHGMIKHEIETERNAITKLHFRPERKWRIFLEQIFKSYDWRIKSKNNLEEWERLLAAFNDKIFGYHSRNTESLQLDTVEVAPVAK